MTVPDRVYSHAEQRINELDHLFRGEPEAVVVFSAEDGKHVIELTIFSGTTIFRVVEKNLRYAGLHRRCGLLHSAPVERAPVEAVQQHQQRCL
ncbi:MAG: hypothetical protein ACLTC3_01705 [Evtepia gabavorous]